MVYGARSMYTGDIIAIFGLRLIVRFDRLFTVRAMPPSSAEAACKAAQLRTDAVAARNTVAVEDDRGIFASLCCQRGQHN